MVNVSGGVVWCFKDNRWIPLQLSSIRLHGVLTQSHWAAITEFLERVANKQLILQDNGFTELTEKHKELMFKNQLIGSKLEFCSDNNNVIKLPDSLVSERKSSLGQIPEDKIVEQPRRPSMPELRSIDRDNLFINNLLKSQSDNPKKTDRISKENDELVLKLLKKYCKYSKDALDDDILSAIEKITDENVAPDPRPPRVRKMGYVPKEDKIYENVNEIILDSLELEDDRNGHIIRWLKQQNSHGGTFADIILPSRRHSSVDFPVSSPTDSRKSSLGERKSSSSGFESQKSSLTTPSTPESRKSSWCESTVTSRKSSVGSNSSCSECEESDSQTQWQKFLKRHLNSKNSEKRLRKQWEAWARNRRRLSLQVDPTWTDHLESQP